MYKHLYEKFGDFQLRNKSGRTVRFTYFIHCPKYGPDMIFSFYGISVQVGGMRNMGRVNRLHFSKIKSAANIIRQGKGDQSNGIKKLIGYR